MTACKMEFESGCCERYGLVAGGEVYRLRWDWWWWIVAVFRVGVAGVGVAGERSGGGVVFGLGRGAAVPDEAMLERNYWLLRGSVCGGNAVVYSESEVCF